MYGSPKVLGNPSAEVLGKFKRNGAAHVDFNFATQKGIGVAQLIPHASPECVDLITKVGYADPTDILLFGSGLTSEIMFQVR